MNTSSAMANVVLVHGGFVDGSGWRAVYDLLTQDGYHVAVVQNPTLSLQGDAAATRLMPIAASSGQSVKRFEKSAKLVLTATPVLGVIREESRRFRVGSFVFV